MRSGALAILLVSLLMLVPAQALSGGGPGDGPTGGDPPGDGTVVLWMRAGHFDPLRDPVPGPGWLHQRSTGDYRLVQFEGPVRPSWVEAIADAGASLLTYLPDHGFFARVPRDRAGEVRDLEHVRYVGPAHPAYRIHPALWDDIAAGADLRADVLTWGGEARARDLARSILLGGGSVDLVDGDRLEAWMPAELALGLVRDPGMAVRWVEPHADLELINDRDARTAHARQNIDGAYISNGDALWAYNPSDDTFGGYAGRNVTIAVADTGQDTGHPAFAGRIVEYYDYGNDGEFDANGHGTHVAGTALGDGSWRSSDVGQDGKYSGLAPQAGLVVQEVFVMGNPGTNGMGRDADQAGATISSNSWISGAFGDYNGICEGYDRLTHDANNVKPGDQPIFYVFGAGNDGRWGEGSIRPPSVAKNVLSVGSTGNDKWGQSSNVVSDFSSRGPAEDGRIKPDVVIPGSVVASARSSYPGAHSGWPRPGDGQSSYVYGSGTSMATPGAAGAAAVATQYLRDAKGVDPSPALLKAVLVNGAVPLSNYEYPGNVQGWGRIDLDRSLLTSSGYRIWREDQAVELDADEGSDEEVYWFQVKSGHDLKVTLTWSDVAGTVNSEKHLINDLDLEMWSPSGKHYLGNRFLGGESVADSTAGADRTNNVEGLLIRNPEAGLWRLRVRAHNVPTGTQDYALVVSGDMERGHVDLVGQGLGATPLDAEEGSNVVLSARVRNLGNREADGVAYRLERDGPDGSTETLATGDLGELGPETSHDLEWNVTGSRGDHVFRLIVDPARAVLESNETNNQLELDYFFRGYDVDIRASITGARGDPGDVVDIPLSITNEGNVPDELRLSLSEPPPGWQVQLTSDMYALDEDESVDLALEVLVPRNATAGERATFDVTVASTGNSSRTGGLMFQVEVNQVFGMEVAALSGPQDMLPGEDRELDLMVRNTGNGLDVFVLILPGQVPGGWWVQLPSAAVEVPLLSDRTVSVVLTSPDRALVGSSVTFDVAVSSSMPGLERNVTFAAKVVQFYDSQVEVLERVTEGDVGQEVVIPLAIRNRGNGPVSYNGDINFPDASWTGGLDVSDLTLQGYEEALGNLTFQVPQGAINRSYDFTMVVISSGGEIFYDNFTFSVHQFHDLTLQVTSATSTVTQGQPAWVQVRLENGGNGVEAVRMTSHPPLMWDFEFSQAETSMEPRSTVVLDLRLETEVATPGGTYDVPITAFFGPLGATQAEVQTQVVVLTRPDLEIVGGDLNVSDANPRVDVLLRITATVRNVGGTVAEDVFVQLYVNDVPEGQPMYVSSIDAGAEEEFIMLWTTNRSGLHLLEVVADYQDDIDEPDEDNNGAEATVDVRALDLQTSPGLTLPLALLAFLAATALVWSVRRRRLQGGGSQDR